MKGFLLLFFIVAGGVLLWNYTKPESVEKTIKRIENTVKKPTIIPQKKQKQYIFVPYWTFTKSFEADSNSSLIYFGLGVDTQGIDKDEDGYKKLKTFTKLTSTTSEIILAIRMTDKLINAQVLKNLDIQQKIASEAVNLAYDNGFDGVLLDYETSAFGFDTTTKNITAFYTLFSKEVKEKGLLFYTTVYGDTYFRARPYDIKKISEMSDKVIIMAYDFSKSRGNPGPNFPLKDNGDYGYSFEKMIGDFQNDADNRKLVVAIGYFGYDWEVGKGGAATANGIPLSTNEIKKKFVDSCKYDACRVTRVTSTSEPSVFYIDDDGENHIVWFEDEQSANKKKEFLKTKGILEIADWAYSYN